MQGIVREVRERYEQDAVYAEAFDWWCREIMPRSLFEEQAEVFDNALVGIYGNHCIDEAVADVFEQDFDLDVNDWPINLIDTEQAFGDIQEEYLVEYTRDNHYFWIIRR